MKQLKVVPISDGKVEYRLPGQPDRVLKDAAGNILYVRADTIGISKNGNWMVVDAPFKASLRVNLSSYQVVPYQSPYIYHFGQNPAVQMAVSDDGKYAVSTSRSGSFNITDITSCSSAPVFIQSPATCSQYLYSSKLSPQISGYSRVFQPRFISNYLISFYAPYYKQSGERVVGKFRMAPPGFTISQLDYLALGDSYTSGEGAYDYFPETDTDENMCHLSKVSYPYLIGQQLEMKNYNSVACSGAKIENIAEFVQRSNIPHPNSMGNRLPGYKTQMDYLASEDPNILTVSIGGNDIGFGEVIKKCLSFLVSDRCYEHYEERVELLELVNEQFNRLTDIYTRLKQNSKPGVKIYVLGYPKILKEDGNCALNVRLNNDEIRFSNLLIDYLNGVVEKATARAGVGYVDVAEAFEGHKMCETHSANVAINGITLGDDGPFGFGPIGNEGFHPNKLGHQLLKAEVLKKTQNFSVPMPQSDPSVQLPEIDLSLEILDAPSSGRSLRSIQPAPSVTSDALTMNNSNQLNVSGEALGLQPNSEVTVEIHSSPVHIGTYVTDELANISASFQVPDVIENGYHTLHIIGKNLLGEEIDLFKSVFVVFSPGDVDGDSILNEYDSCLYIKNSGIDVDADGMDDNCDTEITPKEDDIAAPGDQEGSSNDVLPTLGIVNTANEREQNNTLQTESENATLRDNQGVLTTLQNSVLSEKSNQPIVLPRLADFAYANIPKERINVVGLFVATFGVCALAIFYKRRHVQ